MAENSILRFLENILPKILKATVKGLLWFFLFYALPTLLLSELPEEVLPGYTQLISTFAIVVVFFIVVSELLAGTIFQHALNMGKALVFMAFFVYALNGGFMAFDLPMELGKVHIEADLRVYLAMLLIINFLALAKSLLQAVDYLAKRTERRLAI